MIIFGICWLKWSVFFRFGSALFRWFCFFLNKKIWMQAKVGGLAIGHSCYCGNRGPHLSQRHTRRSSNCHVSFMASVRLILSFFQPMNLFLLFWTCQIAKTFDCFYLLCVSQKIHDCCHNFFLIGEPFFLLFHHHQRVGFFHGITFFVLKWVHFV